MKALIEKDNDHPQFIQNCEKIIARQLDLWKPEELFVHRINNWFDQKWMSFSGTIMHELSIWKGETTIPPFHPNRIEKASFYQRSDGEYKEVGGFKALHIYQSSSNNLKRKVSDFSKDGLMVWYSGNSKINDRGSLMCYFIRNSECLPFFISLSGNKLWNVSQAKGIQREEIQKYLDINF